MCVPNERQLAEPAWRMLAGPTLSQGDDDMSLEQYKDSRHYREVHGKLESLGLAGHIEHLDEYGYTVIPPDLVAPEAFQERLRQAVLDVHERRTGQRIDPANVEHAQLADDVPGAGHWSILTDAPVFEEMLMNPTVLAVARYLCGKSAILSDMLCILKQKHDRLTHPLHTDQHGTPPPLPPYSQVANVTWTLTDYKEGNGPTAVVPKSHLKSRYPTVKEGNFLLDDAPVKPIPIEAPAGSLIAWHGATWHGSYPRENAGLRLNVIMVFTRVYMKQIRDFRSTVPQELLDRHPAEFARLIGANSAYPFRDGKQPAPEDMNVMYAAARNPWA